MPASLRDKSRAPGHHTAAAASGSQRGSVLIIVLWVAFGLVSIALYFAHSMIFELRASDNRQAGLEAEQAIAGAARYASDLLANLEVPGRLPDVQTYQRANVPVGDATFWFLGRSDSHGAPDLPFFSVADEASKLNLNTTGPEMLALLPRMTPDLAAAIQDWRDADSDVSAGGAEDETYARRNPAYKCKNGPFESVDELRLVFGMDLEILYGEDTNQNGVLDPNENDGDRSPPNDNRNGRLDPGLAEYVTVYSREPNTRTNGTPRINVSGGQAQVQLRLESLLQEKFGADRASQILQQLGPIQGSRSLLEFFIRSRMTVEDFARIEGDITVSNGQSLEGLINVNTASAAALACIPGIGVEKAESLVAYRQANPNQLTSLAWVAEALGQEGANQAGPFLTSRSHQFTVDIAALGHQGRGYRRVRFVFDISDGTPKIFHRQDLTHLGWALGKEVLQTGLLARTMP